MIPADAAALIAFTAFLPYADRWVTGALADRAAGRKHALAVKALEAKAPLAPRAGAE